MRNGPQTDPKGVKTYVEWVPKFAGVLPKDMCKLTCRAKGTGYYVVFSQRVINALSVSACAVNYMPHLQLIGPSARTNKKQVYAVKKASVNGFSPVKWLRMGRND